MKHIEEKNWENLMLVMRDDFQSEYKSKIKTD